MKRVLLVISVIFCHLLEAGAQNMIIVEGDVKNKENNDPLQYVQVYTYKTMAEGRDAYAESMSCYNNKMTWLPEKSSQSVTDASGHYEVTIPDNGAIIFYLDPYEPVFMQVRGKRKINTKIDARRTLDAATLTADGGQRLREEETVVFGKSINIKKIYDFDLESLGAVKDLGKANARLVAQMFVVNADATDTLQYYPPMIYDGEQFSVTQQLWSADTLYRTAGKLEDVKDSLVFTGVFDNNDEDNIYFCKAHIWVEDYIKTYYSDTIDVMNTGRLQRPFEFLEYSFDECHLDRQKYYKAPRREKVDDAKDLSLKFKVNSAELDMTDEKTVADISDLKTLLKNICEAPDATLKELHVNGYSSPDGQFAKNLELSKKRTSTVKSELHSVLNRGTIERMYQTGDGHVATWADLAALLERDSLLTEAAAVRNIVDRFPKSIDQQGAQIRKLPYYTKLISPRLPELRTVKCVYNFEVFRFLKPHEILAKYNEDAAFRNGTKPMTLNEYWHLFDLVKDPVQLESLYKRAIAASIKSEKRPWPLPANLLAVSLLRQEKVDTLLLKPFLDETYRANYEIKDVYDPSKIDKVINDESIVANQVQMYMMAKDYKQAARWATLIEAKYPMLRAVARCLAGQLDYRKPEEKASVDLIRNSSPRNELIVNMYMGVYDSTTVKALQRMPQDEPLTDYLKAQRLCRQYKDVKRMNVKFDREKEDPYFRHPDDKEIPLATPEEIEDQKKKVAEVEGLVQEFLALGMTIDDFTKAELEQAKSTLANMMKGETTVIPCECTVYSMAYNYLKRAFEKDKKLVSKAKADAYICEELLNDVLGIETKK